MTVDDELVRFVEERLDEDEERVRRGQPVPWTTEMTERAYREVGAKRKIVILCKVAQEPDAFGRPNIRRGVARRILKEIAAVYADHPDYSPAWRSA